MTKMNAQAPSRQDAARDLRAIREHWGDLLATRLYGPPRHRAEQELTEGQRAERDAVARAERREADPEAPGWSPAPVRLDVVEVIADVADGVLELEEAVREALDLPAAERARRHASTPPVLDAPRNPAGVEEPDGSVHWACAWIEEALPAVAADPVLACHVADEARRMARTVLAAIGHIADSVLIQARCFVCGGVDEEHPGGARTLRLYTEGRLVDAYVLCHNPRCEPDASQCGSRRHGRPMWTADELVWLNAKLDESAGRGAEGEDTDKSPKTFERCHAFAA
jgi:hypothetical protein